MSTNAKLIFGYTDHMGNWNVEKRYIRWSDGYSDAVVSTLREFTSAEKGVDIETLNQAMNRYKEDISFNTETGELMVNGMGE